ncbi:MAG: hypothetical protein J6D37_07095 [Clostridia bacterium]|nr:hypothetical protein [Clostridia bacterium]
MKNNKRFGANFIINAGAVVLSLAAWIVAMVSNSIVGHPLQNGFLIIMLGLGAVVAMTAGILLGSKYRNVSEVLTFIGFLLSGVAMALLISSRVVLASGLFTWDPYNELGWMAFNTAIASFAIYFVSEVALIVNAFMKKA